MVLVGDYRDGGKELALSSLVTVSTCAGHTVLQQDNVTTHQDLLGEP